MFRPRYFAEIFALSIFIGVPFKASAEIGLMQYDTIGKFDIYTANAGHAGVYLSRICMTGEANKFRVCDDEDKTKGQTGVVVQRYANLSGRSKKLLKEHANADWIALPFNMNLYGTLDHNSAPILAAPKVADQLRSNAYHKDNDQLHIQEITDPNSSESELAQKQQLKDQAPDPLAVGDWQYSISASEIRTGHMLSLDTPVEGDQQIVDFLNDPKNDIGHFQAQLNNCANFANVIFKIGYGDNFNGRGELEDAFLVTPSSDSKEVKAFANKADIPYQVTVFNQIPGAFAPSSQPTDIVTDSNSNMVFGQLVSHVLPAPAGTIFTILKLARRFGLPLPGFRPYMNLNKEVKQHGTEELAQISNDLRTAKQNKENKDVIGEIKIKLQGLQNLTFGTKKCWKSKSDEFKEVLKNAFAANVIDEKYEKEFNMHQTLNKLLRLIPMIHLNPTHQKLISDIMNSPDASIVQDQSGLTLHKGDVVAGLSRENIDSFDPKLGFLEIAASLDYQLDSNEVLMADDFDKDWATLTELGHKVGLTVDALSSASIQECAKQEDPTIEENLTGPAGGPAIGTIDSDGQVIAPPTEDGPVPPTPVTGTTPQAAAAS